MQPVINYIKHPSSLCDSLVCHLGWWLPDSVYLKLRYRFQMGKRLNLNNPQTFSEKIQWLKLYDRNPEYTKMVDKVQVKEYVASIIGKEYVIPLLGVWNKPEDIDWDSLPNKFVLKTNHSGGSTGVVICTDKLSFNKEDAITRLNRSLKSDVYRNLREWPYKNVSRCVMAEQYIQPAPNEKDLPDYKFFCFDGEPIYCQVISGRSETMSIDFFDMEWKHQSFHEPKDYPFAEIEPKKPECFEKMCSAARLLAQGKPFSRIDFYQVKYKVLFGEITFYPTSGMGGFDPEEWDYKFGEWLTLPKV